MKASKQFTITKFSQIKLHGSKWITSRPTRSWLIKRDTIHGGANLRNCHFLERGAVYRGATCCL